MNKKQIHENAVVKSKNYKRAEFELLEAIELVDKHKVFYTYQCKSLCDYCMTHLNLSVDVARMFIGIMKVSQAVPELKQAIKNQKIYTSNARKIVPIITPENQAFWLKEAEGSLNHLKEKLAEAFPERKKRETVKSISEEYMSITVYIKKSQFTHIKNAQDILSKRKKRMLMLDELFVENAKFFNEKNDPIEKAKRTQTKKEKTQPAENTEENSEKLGSIPKNAIPAANLHVVNLRDQRECQHQDKNGKKCGSRLFTEIHHIKPRSQGGSHEPSNLITLCSGHHKAHHFNESIHFFYHREYQTQ